MQRDDFMELQLEQLDYRSLRSIYGDGNGFPSRMAFLHPDCVESFNSANRECGGLVLSDVWRSSLISLRRKYPESGGVRRGAQYPAHSGHNYGFSIDIDVNATMRNAGVALKSTLDSILEKHGLYCHRRDGRRGHEEWHYNILTLGLGPKHWMRFARKTTASSLDKMVVSSYGAWWKLSDKQIQRCLKKIALYPGAIDGDIGPMSREAVRSFQRAWRLKVDGVPGTNTCRLLSFRCAELRHPKLRSLWTVRG